VLPLIMPGAQAVVAQLTNIDNRTLCVWNGHTRRFVSVKHERLGPSLCISPYAVRLHKLPAWDAAYIPNDVEVIVKPRGRPCLADPSRDQRLTPCLGEDVGFEAIDNDVWQVDFGPHPRGWFVERHRRIEET
jgi:hypothetical protein